MRKVYDGRYGWLVVGVALALIANGRGMVAQAAWLFPIPWLVFIERSRPGRGLSVAFVLYTLVTFVAWQGMIPAPGVIYYIIAAVYAVFYFLPFVLHRLIATRLAGFSSTLVFPLAWVGIEFLFHTWITPYGSWFSLAYTQSNHLALLQMASLTGTAGISFLMMWFASVAVWMIPTERTARERLSLASGYALVLLAALVFGEVRLASSATDAPAIRAAGIVPTGVLMSEFEKALAPARRGESLGTAEIDTLEALAGRLNDDLFDRTLREARSGAEIVVWSETAGRVFEEDESKFLRAARRMAAEERVHLFLAYGVFLTDSNPPFANKVVAIDADGRVAWEYEKDHPIVGAESGLIRTGDGIIRALQTDFGRIGAVICHDLDFPRLLLQVRKENIGLIVGPSADWEDITPLHGNMAVLRAIEGGFSLFRPTSGGRTLAADSRGRVVTVEDYPHDAVVTSLRIAREPTLYYAVGDLFAWLCILGLVILIFRAFRGTASPSGV